MRGSRRGSVSGSSLPLAPGHPPRGRFAPSRPLALREGGCPSSPPFRPRVPAFAERRAGVFLWPPPRGCLFRASSPCAFSGAQGRFRPHPGPLPPGGRGDERTRPGGRVMGPAGAGPRLSLGPCTRTSAPSLSIASSVRRGRPRRGARCCAERRARPLATCSSRCPRRQTVSMEDGSATGSPFGVRRLPSIRPRGLLSRCSLPLAVDEGRRLVEHAPSPGPWLGIPRSTALRAPSSRPLALREGGLPLRPSALGFPLPRE